MLNLSEKNILLNNSARNKEEAIRLVAAELVKSNNVAEGYETGMLTREMQTSTFLGNGIAIPHGTLDTRNLVKKTGVQIIQIPQGIEWDEGNIAYVVIGIAAKSDEHLALLRQLTAVLSDDKAAETLAKTQNFEEFIAVLSGRKNIPALSEELISLAVESSSLITLSAINASKLQEKGYVSQVFISDVVTNQALNLGDNVFITDSVNGNLANGIAIARNTQGQTLVTVSATDNNFQKSLTQLLKKDIRKQLATASITQLVTLLSGEILEPSTSVTPVTQTTNNQVINTFTVRNENGLHARPSAVLVNEVKKFSSKIEVQNVDKNSPLVNAKSLMKVVALGATKDTTLRFVATGDDAEAALSSIGKAIETGLGE